MSPNSIARLARPGARGRPAGAGPDPGVGVGVGAGGGAGAGATALRAPGASQLARLAGRCWPGARTCRAPSTSPMTNERRARCITRAHRWPISGPAIGDRRSPIAGPPAHGRASARRAPPAGVYMQMRLTGRMTMTEAQFKRNWRAPKRLHHGQWAAGGRPMVRCANGRARACQLAGANGHSKMMRHIWRAPAAPNNSDQLNRRQAGAQTKRPAAGRRPPTPPTPPGPRNSNNWRQMCLKCKTFN